MKLPQVSEIRWRQPMFGPDGEQHTFKVGDRVRIARLADTMTTRAIIGHRGIIEEIDHLSSSSVEVRCATCGSVHTMHEQELDFFGDDLVQLLEEKAGIKPETVVVDESTQNLEDFLAVAMFKAGFDRISVQDKPMPHGDPRMARPVWSKHVYGVISKLAPLRVYADALIKIAHDAGGYLAEWHTYSHKGGYNSVITEADLDTLTLEMPIRALMVAKATTDMGEYGEIKDMVLYWLQDRHQIDIGAIYRATKELGFAMGDWTHRDYHTGPDGDIPSYTMRIEWVKSDGRGFETFMEWAKEHWVWVGFFTVYIDDRGSRRGAYEEVSVKKETGDGPVTIEEVEDVPF
jgi:hypothetical protein